MWRTNKNTGLSLMSPNSSDSDTVAILRQIARLMEYWKLTLFYIAGVLTLWLVLAYTDKI